jgi:hypothetical protein
MAPFVRKTNITSIGFLRVDEAGNNSESDFEEEFFQ